MEHSVSSNLRLYEAHMPRRLEKKLIRICFLARPLVLDAARVIWGPAGAGFSRTRMQNQAWHNAARSFWASRWTGCDSNCPIAESCIYQYMAAAAKRCQSVLWNTAGKDVRSSGTNTGGRGLPSAASPEGKRVPASSQAISPSNVAAHRNARAPSRWPW